MRLASFIPPLLPAFVVLGVAGVIQAQTVSNFVSLPPCRLVDTRDTNRGSLGSPALVGMSQRNFAILSGSCHVPATATAYSLNVTVVPHESLTYLSVWPTGQQQPLVSTLNSDSGAVTANGAIMPAGTNGDIAVFATGNTELIIDINGYFAAPSTQAVDQLTQLVSQAQQGVTSVSAGIGQAAQQIASLQQQVTAANTVIAQANQQISTVQQNLTASNAISNQITNLVSATNQMLQIVRFNSAQQNVAFGNETSLVGSQNSSIGNQALHLNSNGSANTAVGSGALDLNTTGNNNVGLGVNVLGGNETGSGNIAIGYKSASLIGSGDNVIEIGNQGQAGDTSVIRIGTQDIQTAAYMAGIYQSQPGTDPYGTAVLVDDTGRLSTFQSSIRYKEDVRDIGSASDELMHLRPVQFRYKKPSRRGDKPIQYGLIAEEVEAIFPNLVVHDAQGRAETVQYHQLPALLLNEMQKQHQQIVEQDRLIQQQGEQIKYLMGKLGTK